MAKRRRGDIVRQIGNQRVGLALKQIAWLDFQQIARQNLDLAQRGCHLSQNSQHLALNLDGYDSPLWTNGLSQRQRQDTHARANLQGRRAGRQFCRIDNLVERLAVLQPVLPKRLLRAHPMLLEQPPHHRRTTQIGHGSISFSRMLCRL